MEDARGKGNLAEIARKAQRDARLAAELRANLKRRKAAARARTDSPDDDSDGAAHPGADEVQPTANKDTV